MFSWSSLLSFVHLVGLALGVGAATVKLALLIRCNADPTFVPVYIRVAKPITTQIVLGMILLTLSGIVWLLLGYHVTPRLVVKLVLAAAVWVLGPYMDNVVEPRFRKLAPASGEPPSADFDRAQRQFLSLELVATALFYAILVIWILI
jgi:hypothetical protein